MATHVARGREPRVPVLFFDPGGSALIVGGCDGARKWRLHGGRDWVGRHEVGVMLS